MSINNSKVENIIKLVKKGHKNKESMVEPNRRNLVANEEDFGATAENLGESRNERNEDDEMDRDGDALAATAEVALTIAADVGDLGMDMDAHAGNGEIHGESTKRNKAVDVGIVAGEDWNDWISESSLSSGTNDSHNLSLYP